ncbi:Hypothetical predicted protein [Octopus vulgaris]|uniref:Uncharacterized protein n=1 Tax=Octopus vulgaris TaxID=6645 RepID=A0AA36AGW0_OCTVU|nr:Hypothetical predicted protein [Octopus vulgaris]
MYQLINYQNIDPEISKAAAKKFSIHFWYLALETVALSMFDDNVPTEVKANISQVILEADKAPGTKTFFMRFSISTDFLDEDPSTWKNDPSYKSGLENLEKTVVNDVAERDVKFIQDYNILTNDETEKQFVLQIITKNHKTDSTAINSSLMQK